MTCRMAKRYLPFLLLDYCLLTRLDVTNDNKISVFDYKTSKNKINEKDAIKSIQLAIYAIYVSISKLTKEDGRKLGSLPEKLTYLFLRFDEISFSKYSLATAPVKISNIQLGQ